MRIKIVPTKSGYFLLFLLFLFYVFSIMSQTGLIYIFMGIIIGTFVVNIIYGIKCIKHVIPYNFDEIITTESKPIDTKIKITNNSNKNFSFIKVKCNFGEFLNVGNIEGKSCKHITPEVIFKIRGIYLINKMTVETVNPFGLMRISKLLNGTGRIKVYPKLYNCDSPSASGFEPMLGGHYKGKHTSLFGDDFSGVRPYVPGDPVKFIDWKTSSKGMGVFIKEFGEEYSGKISFIIQNKNNFINKDDNIIDWAVRAAGSLAFSALDAGHNIEISDCSNKFPFNASPFSNPVEILDFLTVIKERGNNVIDIESVISSLHKKSSLAFVLTENNSGILDVAGKYAGSGRKVSVYFPFNIKNEKIISSHYKIYYFNKECIWQD